MKLTVGSQDQTLADLVDQTQAYVRSFTKDQDVSTYLVEDLPVDGYTLKVAEGNMVSRGRAQVGDEVVYISDVDRPNGVATIAPFGRGMDGTDVVAHASGEMVTTNPLYPRHVVARAINQTISAMAGMLYEVKSFQVPAKAIGFNYEVPSDTRHVINVSYVAKPQSYKYPTYARNWNFDQTADPSLSSTGKAVMIYDVITPLFTFTITYGRMLRQLENMDSLVTESGVPLTAYDAVVLGAASKLLSVASAALLQSQAIEASVVNEKVGPEQAMEQSRYLYGLYQQRLAEERELLLSQTVIRSRRQRG